MICERVGADQHLPVLGQARYWPDLGRTRLLPALIGEMAPRQVLDRFLGAKGKVDSGAAANAEESENQAIDALHALTSVRALLISGLQSGAPRPVTLMFLLRPLEFWKGDVMQTSPIRLQGPSKCSSSAGSPSGRKPVAFLFA